VTVTCGGGTGPQSRNPSSTSSCSTKLGAFVSFVLLETDALIACMIRCKHPLHCPLKISLCAHIMHCC